MPSLAAPRHVVTHSLQHFVDRNRPDKSITTAAVSEIAFVQRYAGERVWRLEFLPSEHLKHVLADEPNDFDGQAGGRDNTNLGVAIERAADKLDILWCSHGTHDQCFRFEQHSADLWDRANACDVIGPAPSAGNGDPSCPDSDKEAGQACRRGCGLCDRSRAQSERCGRPR